MNFIEKYIKNAMNLVHNMSIVDVSIFKLTVFAAALWIAKLFPVVLSLNTWLYVAVWLGGSVYLLRKMNWK